MRKVLGILLSLVCLLTLSFPSHAVGPTYIQKTNQVFQLIRDNLSRVKRNEYTCLINEGNSLELAARLIAVSEETQTPFEDILRYATERGVLKVAGSAVTYIKGSNLGQATITFKPLQWITPVEYNSISVERTAARINTQLYAYVSKQPVIQKYKDAADAKWLQETSNLRSPVKLSWWKDLLSSPYGERENEEINEELGAELFTSGFHYGLDFAVGLRTEIYPCAAGTVISVSEGDTGLGNSIVVSHGIYTTVYGHLDEILVKQGERVMRDTLLGYSGDSGWSTGPHLHLEVYRSGQVIDPALVLVGY